MSMKIKFDITGNPENPTLILAYRDGRKIGELVAENVIAKDSMMNAAELSFKVRKYLNGKKNALWDKISDFKLLWYKEADLWFEIYIDINETNETVKSVSCTQLGQAELSQIMLYNVEINTENDIARDDYEIPTVLYNEEHPKASLLHRIMEKAKHYSVIYVDSTIANIQRTFTFDGTSIYDAFQQIAEEIKCLFVFHSNSDGNGNIQRTISVYDLESSCIECGHRGEFTAECPECGSTNINEGYGEDTTIFVTSDELAENVQFTTDTGSVKNCFKLEAGDDLMTATIRNCNPNGTDYIWYISDDVKKDMSPELVEKIESYDALFETCQNDYVADIDESMLEQYNNLVKKYQAYNADLQEIPTPIKGYPALMTAIYNTIDLSLYLESTLMPDATMQDTDASKQVALLTPNNLSPVAVTDVSNISLATANSAVLSMAKIIVDSRYRVKVNESSLLNQIWTGNFIVTNYSDEEDEAISSTVSIVINDDYEYFVQQKLNKSIKEKDTDDLSVTGLFKLEYDLFCNELKKYGLSSLISFHDACQACIDILIKQGIADSQTWSGSDPNLYEDLYMPYYQKLKAIEGEIKIRQDEINLIEGAYDSDSVLTQNGLQTYLDNIRYEVQKQLDFQSYIGDELWLEFCTYRREDKYSNSNYISDGLSNAELFEKAIEFIGVAKNEIYKSAELQHSISSSLKNLLVIPKFKVLVEYFATGNWIRIFVDDKVYKLRLLDYEVDFDNIDSLSVDFSDVLKTANGESDQKSIMSKITSMTTSYDSVQRQASQGSKSNQTLKQWVDKGFDVTNTKIVGGADNQTQTWDSHGMLFREYEPITDSYDDEQLKIINSTIAITNDNWETVKTAVGAYYYFDPRTEKLTRAYGVNAEVLVGKLILGEQLGIYNDSGSLSFDDKGFKITNGTNSFRVDPNSEILLAISNTEKDVFYIDKHGKLNISGDGAGIDISANSDITGMQSNITQNSEKIATEIKNREDADNALSSSITQTVDKIRAEVSEKVTQSEVDEAIDNIAEFHNTAVDITARGVNINTTGSIRAFVQNQEELTIDENGVSGRVLVAKERIDAPNVILNNLSPVIPWKGSIQASIDAAPKWLTVDATLEVPAGTYLEDVVIRGFKGARLVISLYQNVTINGAITVEHCDDVLINSSALGKAKIFPRTAINAITAKNVGFLELRNLQVSGYRNRTSASEGSSSCISITSGTMYVENCCVEYSCSYAILFYAGARGHVQNCIGGVKGGNYTTGANLGYGVYGSAGAHFAVYGKCPVAVTNTGGWLSTVLTEGLVPTEGGMEYVAPTEFTKSFNISKHCTYLYSVQRIRDDQTTTFSQGHYGGYTAGGLNWRTGAMWFKDATDALEGRQIVSATLRLRRAGGGVQSSVPVYLGWTALKESEFRSTLTPPFEKSTNNYPSTGLVREEEGVYDVTELMTAVQQGYAIAVREPTKNYGSSANDFSDAYTYFYGKGSSYEPVLTVTYK